MVRLLERRFRVKVPLEKAWAHIEQVEQWPSWARHIRRIELRPAGPLRPDSEGTIHLTNGVRSVFRMEELNPGRNWKWVGPFLWITVRYDHRFTRAGPGETEIGFVLDGEGVGVGVFGRLFAAIYAWKLDRAIPNLIREIEHETAAEGVRSAGSPAKAERMKNMYLVVYRPGPAWLPGRPVGEQPLKNHGRYMLSLYVKGSLKFAGRFSDNAGGAAAFEATDDDEARAVVAADPAVVSGVFLGEVHPWDLVDWDRHVKK